MNARSTQPRIRRMLPFLSVAFVIALAAAPSTARANPDVYQKTLKSTCWIVRQEGDIIYMGSGVLVDRDKKLVISNQHVVSEDREVTVFFPVMKDGTAISEKRWYFQNRDKVGLKGRV